MGNNLEPHNQAKRNGRNGASYLEVEEAGVGEAVFGVVPARLHAAARRGDERRRGETLGSALAGGGE